MLTKKQYELLLYIDEFLSERGISPSFDEMKDALNLKSKSGIHRLITGLEERGFIRRLAHRARALEVVKLPENMDGLPSKPTASKFAPNVIRGDFTAPAATPAEGAEAVELPLWGKIAAGNVNYQEPDPSETFSVPAGLLAGGEHFALEVYGESMVDAGIFDGDIAIIQRKDTVDNGAIVVALVDNDEVTLKRLRRKGKSVALEPANESFETRILPADRVRVQGRLVGLVRKY